ncbi:MAG: cob(I)yrinic acid a,c-diamide adenosyltransferase [Austwickia sp.]|nr:cob(I)yrinic acid a,c-diamide adenosyltransferase [Austwickia sp.]MBK8437867.1 cob(I)yrinic acid a,c-diamide adenosyltransferase [Austwickia sp.]
MPDAARCRVPAEPASRRERPLLMVFTGEGKGKTTAAMGMALRAWHRGWPIGVFQFIKSGRWPTGERAAFQALDAAHRDSGVGAPVHWESLGSGFTWLPRRTGPDPAELAQHGWSRVAQALATQQYTFVLLDELSYPLARGWVDVEEVVAALAARPGFQQVAITGRGCPEALLAAADLVTTMTKVRHPFDAGHRGQQGIEW